MSNIIGAECPYCKKALTETDDLAVCPECGTPHHRACYKEHGECANESLHADGFVWRRPVAEISEIPVDEPCPVCGHLNNSENLFCNYCGARMKNPAQAAAVPAQQSFPDMAMLLGEGLENKVKGSETLDNIPIADWATYIGTNQYFYLYHIDRQSKTGSKLGFSLIAVFFPFLYFMYRKLWGTAAIALVSGFLLSIPSAIFQVLVPLGYDFGIAVATWETVALVTSFLLCVVNCCWGLFSMYIYRTTARNRMYKLHAESASEAEYQQRLKKIGGPSRLAVLIAVGCYAAAILAATAFLSGVV